MKQFLFFLSTAIFAIFIGSQITEGILLVPYWQSMSSTEFYGYYNEFGPSIGRFYTILTVVAALIPLFLSVYAKAIDKKAFQLALVSALFAILFISAFYIYFKGTNELFYQAAFSEAELQNELVTWSKWHWGRIVLEFVSLAFLILSLVRIQMSKVD